MLIAAEFWTEATQVAPALPASESASMAAPVPYPPDYRTALADIDRALETARARANRRDGGWLAHEMLARAHFERARLTGSYQDYAAAEAALERSFGLAPDRSGPHLLQAAFDLTMHRLERSESQLDSIRRYSVPPDGDEQAEIEAMRGDIALYRGHYSEALRRYDQANRLRPGAADFRRAVYHAATGNPETALNLIDRLDRRGRRISVQTKARIELQRGIIYLDRGRIRQARVHFDRANEVFPGYWLIEEHIAETLTLSGELEEAERRYRDLIERTESPEFMDALATIYRQRGDRQSALRWTRRAARIWQERLRAFPEGTYAHALDNCLAAGDSGCAVALAYRNHLARPYGESKALLAEALVSAGRRQEGREVMADLLASPWRSPRTERVALQLAD
jgi:tetratricopeptide (TPR) repeat protein